ncbi:MAG: class I SAM-dependent rRNA methyltransferase [Candidatus Sumerlaeota bacterium]|nr:class I SAM-dependent rRNA methyltransferase [Candidatus Sumerlaeota bacterium]
MKRRVGRRAERGHLWVFSNEVEAIEGEPQPGDEVKVFSGKRKFLGMGLFSKSSMIRARIYSRLWEQPCDRAFIAGRLQAARAYRETFGPLPHSYRLIHSESDGLPGLIVDVFGDQLVIQISTFAMEARRAALMESLIEVCSPRAIIERSDVPYRTVEGLEETKGCIHGEMRAPCEIEENGAIVLADLLEGQKTGYYLDQVQNRTLAIPFFKDKRVLDLFCYVGGWSLVAAVHGARETLGIDSSQAALELARAAARRNHLPPERCAFEEADVFEFVRKAVAENRQFDVIILDPPALAKSKRDAENALKAYRELNLRAMKLLSEDGLLITCSCSHNVGLDDFRDMLTMAAKDAHSDFSIAIQSGQSWDHPVHLQTPETSYLKVFFLRKRR